MAVGCKEVAAGFEAILRSPRHRLGNCRMRRPDSPTLRFTQHVRSVSCTPALQSLIVKFLAQTLTTRSSCEVPTHYAHYTLVCGALCDQRHTPLLAYLCFSRS